MTHPSWPTTMPRTPAERAVALVDTLDNHAARTLLRQVAHYLAETQAKVGDIPATDSTGRAAVEADAYRWIFETVLGGSQP